MGMVQAREAVDPRIVLIAESLPREALLRLYSRCIVFSSSYCSKGFGRDTEALQLARVPQIELSLA